MRLDAISQSINGEILSANISLFKAGYVQPTALENGLVPLDIDVTPFDNSKSHKEGVSRTYKNFDGYAPIMAYIGTEGYGCNFELREGSHHCQNGTPDFLRETIAAAKQMTNQTLLVRMDSGNDAVENYAVLHWVDSQVEFLVKHNFRPENRDEMAAKLRKVCKISAVPVRERLYTWEVHGVLFIRKKRAISPFVRYMRSLT